MYKIDSVITPEEKEYLLKVDAAKFINNLVDKDILYTIIKDLDVFNNVSLICFYNLFTVLVGIYFPTFLAKQHIKAVNLNSELKNSIRSLAIRCTLVTDYHWEERNELCYKYVIEFGSLSIFILDDIKRSSCGLSVEHNSVTYCNSVEKIVELNNSILFLYTEFVDNMFIEL